MAVVNTLSTNISNMDASPRILTSGYIAGGSDTISVGTVQAQSTDSIGSTYRYGFLPSGVRIEDILLQNDATTAGVWNLGVALNDQQSLNLGAISGSTSGPAALVATWSSTVAYVPGNVVLLAGVVYYCTTGNTNSQPPSGNWTTGGPQIAPAGSASFIPNCGQILGSGISTAAANPTWKPIYSPSIGAVGFKAANVTLRIWELLGFQNDPQYEFHVVLTSTTAPTAQGNISLQWEWVR
jgi:hypothetical protein